MAERQKMLACYFNVLSKRMQDSKCAGSMVVIRAELYV